MEAGTLSGPGPLLMLKSLIFTNMSFLLIKIEFRFTSNLQLKDESGALVVGKVYTDLKCFAKRFEILQISE